jgi:hypothetical protein
VSGLAGRVVLTRLAGVPHPWGATSCRAGGSSSYLLSRFTIPTHGSPRRYVFAKERLPLRTQRLMRSKKGQAALAELPHYRERLAANGAHLGVYEWFLFW